MRTACQFKTFHEDTVWHATALAGCRRIEHCGASRTERRRAVYNSGGCGHENASKAAFNRACHTGTLQSPPLVHVKRAAALHETAGWSQCWRGATGQVDFTSLSITRPIAHRFVDSADSWRDLPENLSRTAWIDMTNRPVIGWSDIDD